MDGMNPVLRRLLNEAPTLAFLVAGIVGLGESDAAVWKEAVASIASLVTWFTVRASTIGPATHVELRRKARLEDAAVKSNLERYVGETE